MMAVMAKKTPACNRLRRGLESLYHPRANVAMIPRAETEEGM